MTEGNKVYLCNECGYSGLPVKKEHDGVNFLGCPDCGAEFSLMRYIGDMINGEFVPKDG